MNRKQRNNPFRQNADVLAEMLQLRREGNSLRALAKRYGCDHKTIDNECLRNSLVIKFVRTPRVKKPVDPNRKLRSNPFKDNSENLQEMLVLKEKGVTLRQLGMKYGCSYQTVKNECIRNGITTGFRKNGITLTDSNDNFIPLNKKTVSVAQAMKANSRESVRNRFDYIDETGQAVNKGKRYIDYVREQFGQQGVDRIRKRRKEVL